MMKILPLITLIFPFLSLSNTYCERIVNEIKTNEVYLDNENRAYRVISTDRLYFNTAPSNRCKDPGLFLIKNDDVIGYTEYGDFLYAGYVNKNGDIVSGWLDMSKLKKMNYTYGPK